MVYGILLDCAVLATIFLLVSFWSVVSEHLILSGFGSLLAAVALLVWHERIEQWDIFSRAFAWSIKGAAVLSVLIGIGLLGAGIFSLAWRYLP